MLTFFRNWRRSWAGILAVMMMTLNLMSVAVAATSDHHGDDNQYAISDNGMHLGHVGDTHPEHRQHMDAQECQEASCHVFLLDTYSLIFESSNVGKYVASSADQWAVMSQALPYRPPRSFL